MWSKRRDVLDHLRRELAELRGEAAAARGDSSAALNDVRCALGAVQGSVDEVRAAVDPFRGPRAAQLTFLHTALLGFAPDMETSLEILNRTSSLRAATLAILDSPRFRLAVRPDLPLWPRDKWVAVDYHGLVIWVNLHDRYVAPTILDGTYETALVDIMLSHLRPGATVIDIGANVGVWSLQAARAVGEGGRVFSFEPRADTFAMLQRSVEHNGFGDRVVLSAHALSNQSGEARLGHHAGNPGASFVRPSEAADSSDPVILTTLDEVDFGDRVDFLKIDVEGFETRVLRGGEAFFRRYRPLVTSEVFPTLLRENGGSSAEDYVALWERYGYAVRFVDGSPGGRALRAADLRDEATFPPLFDIICEPC